MLGHTCDVINNTFRTARTARTAILPCCLKYMPMFGHLVHSKDGNPTLAIGIFSSTS